MLSKIQILKLKDKLLKDLLKHANADLTFLATEVNMPRSSVYRWKESGLSDRAVMLILKGKLQCFVPQELKEYINNKYKDRDNA